METNELMIGDWVMYKGESTMVYEIDDYYKRINTEPDGYDSIKCIDISDIHPIPLTPEILMKNGWRKIGRKTYMDEQTCVLANYSDNEWKMSYGDIDDFTSIPNICYVHKLQHTLRLCNIDKEIKL